MYLSLHSPWLHNDMKVNKLPHATQNIYTVIIIPIHMKTLCQGEFKQQDVDDDVAGIFINTATTSFDCVWAPRINVTNTESTSSCPAVVPHSVSSEHGPSVGCNSLINVWDPLLQHANTFIPILCALTLHLTYLIYCDFMFCVLFSIWTRSRK